MSNAATIKAPRGTVSTIRAVDRSTLRVVRKTPVETTEGRAYASLYTPEDCAVALDYAEWIVGCEASLYFLTPPKVPTFTNEEAAQ